MSTLHFTLTTDNGAPIHDERVLVLLPSGSAREAYSDGAGEVVLIDLPVAAGTPLYVMLPDVLEAWGPDVPEFILDDHGHRLRTPATSHASDMHFALNKDDADKLQKVDDAGQPVTAANDRWATMAPYRSLDRTKHLAVTTAVRSSNARIKAPLVINHLSEMEKFQHISSLLMENRAWYVSGKLNYSATTRRWHALKGAVCNQLVQFFLGYWYNHNNAYTAGGSSKSMVRQMENDSGTDHSASNYPYRGYRDVVDGPLPPPPLPEDPSKTMPVVPYAGPTYRNGKRLRREWCKIRPQDLREAAGVWSLRTDWQHSLAPFNVYSVASDKGKGGDIIKDHHGGFLLNDPVSGLRTFTADGHKSGGKYSHTPIVVKGLNVILDGAKKKKLHLLVWPMQTLRPGGYAPSGTGAPNYLSDKEMGALNKRTGTSVIDPMFRQSLSRFIHWDGPPN